MITPAYLVAAAIGGVFFLFFQSNVILPSATGKVYWDTEYQEAQMTNLQNFFSAAPAITLIANGVFYLIPEIPIVSGAIYGFGLGFGGPLLLYHLHLYASIR